MKYDGELNQMTLPWWSEVKHSTLIPVGGEEAFLYLHYLNDLELLIQQTATDNPDPHPEVKYKNAQTHSGPAKVKISRIKITKIVSPIGPENHQF